MTLCILKNSRVLISKMIIAFSNSILKIPKCDIFCEKSRFFFIRKTLCEPKGALSGLKQFLTTGGPLENDEKSFLFHLKRTFILKIFKFLSWLFGHAEKLLDQKDKVNFKIFDITTWLANNCNTHIDQCLKK